MTNQQPPRDERGRFMSSEIPRWLICRGCGRPLTRADELYLPGGQACRECADKERDRLTSASVEWYGDRADRPKLADLTPSAEQVADWLAAYGNGPPRARPDSPIEGERRSLAQRVFGEEPDTSTERSTR